MSDTPVSSGESGLSPGARLGHYEIVGLLGAGGMGEVYRARDTKLHRDIALKLLPPDTSADPQSRQRLEREARAVAALNHPNIVTIHSVDEADGRLFLTMELVSGRPLSEMIGRGGLPLERLLHIAVPLADAVSTAHASGITHRDLKPANVMVTSDGHVKVLDFGLAKLRDVGPAGDRTVTKTPEMITDQGGILGTIAYMSPEQAEGKTVDGRAAVQGRHEPVDADGDHARYTEVGNRDQPGAPQGTRPRDSARAGEGPRRGALRGSQRREASRSWPPYGD